MPNGGEDCCGTCPYNSKNKGLSGYAHAHDPEASYCSIRRLPIEFAFYTYCANHPARTREWIEIPIGPVFRSESLPPRWIWQDSPDSGAIREVLLELLAKIPLAPPDDYPMGLRRWEVVIWQLGEFREPRAVADLKRLAGLPLQGPWTVPGGRACTAVEIHALEALHKIEGHPDDDPCPASGRFLRSKPARRKRA